MVNNNSNSDVIKMVTSPGELVTISERYSVKDDGIYHIREEVRNVGSLASKRLVMPKDIFIEAFKKYVGGTL